jgi:hypothetical protein
MSTSIGTCRSKSAQVSGNHFHKQCPITGEVFYDIHKYQQREWGPYPNGRIRTIKLLATSFNIQLGNTDAPLNLQQAKEALQYCYEVESMSTLQLHKQFNLKCSVGHVSNLLKALNIKRRSLSDAAALSIIYGRAPTVGQGYKSGHHKDWQDKDHFYRSSYELRYYQILDQIQIPYNTESIRIPYFDSNLQKHRVAIPDIVIHNSVIIEIKSEWTYNKQNMIDKFKVYQDHGYSMILSLDFKDHIINSVYDLP